MNEIGALIISASESSLSQEVCDLEETSHLTMLKP